MPRSPAGLRAIVIALAAALVLGFAPPPGLGPEAAAAASSSDIPGIPMPAGVATGLLGGDIYDVVYSLDVEPGTVILASLAGPVGTDFDLYLFDASATTVVTNLGVVAHSTGPTSSESLSYAVVSTSTSTRRRRPSGPSRWPSRSWPIGLPWRP
jgi:hypothetical protein